MQTGEKTASLTTVMGIVDVHMHKTEFRPTFMTSNKLGNLELSKCIKNFNLKSEIRNIKATKRKHRPPLQHTGLGTDFLNRA